MLNDILSAEPIAKALEAQLLGSSAAPTASHSAVAPMGAAASPSSSSPSPLIPESSSVYPVTAMLPRSLQLDALLIDNAFVKLLREQVLGALVVEGGSSGLAEFDLVEKEVARMKRLRQRRREGLVDSDDDDDDDRRLGGSRIDDGADANAPREALVSSPVYTFFAETLPLWRSRYQEEITLLLKILLFRLTVMKRPSLPSASADAQQTVGIADANTADVNSRLVAGASVGDHMQNLTYRSEHALRLAAVKTVQSHPLQKSGGVSGGAGAGNRFFNSTAWLYFASYVVSLLPSAATSRVLSPASSPSTRVNAFVRGQPLLHSASGVYSPARWQHCLLLFFTILLPYAMDKLRQHVMRMRNHAYYADDDDDGEGGRGGVASAEREVHRRREAWWQKTLATLEKIETMLSVLDITNTVLFFAQGRYRSLSERLLGLRLVTGTQKMHQFISFEIMNQQLSYGVTLNFIALLGKIFDIRRIAGGIGAIGRGLATTAASSLFGSGAGRAVIGGGSDDGSGDEGIGEEVGGAATSSAANPPPFRPRDRCAICGRSPIVMPRIPSPSSSSCRHVFCYYCITQQLQTLTEEERDRGEGVPCARCGNTIDSVRPLPRVQQ